MKGNYIGKKPSTYGAISANKSGMWEIYDQGQAVSDTQWTGQPWEVNNGYYSNKRLLLGLPASETSIHDVQFSTDGINLYILGQGNDTIYQYTCSTAWDIGTASYSSRVLNTTVQENSPAGFFFKSDGTKVYVLGTINDTIYQYALATEWDIGSAVYENKSFSVNAQDGTPNGLFFKPDGTKFYIVGSTNDRVYQYSCSTAWDVSTGSYENKSFLVSTQETSPFALFFKDDGTKFYVVGSTSDIVYQYSCSTAWDVSTGSYDSKLCRVGGLDGTPTGLCFKSDGTKLYIAGNGTSLVSEINLSTAWDVSLNNGAGGMFYVGGQDTGPREVFFKDDGTKFYIIGSTGDRVYQYACSTAWDVSTGSYENKSFLVSTQESSPQGLFFKPDGTKFYIVGNLNRVVYQYSCSTAWDVSTASYDSKSFSVNAQETLANSVFFKDDGTKFYIIGQTADSVFQYSCSTAWDVSTASYDTKSFSVTTQDTAPTGLFFKSDGTKFYIVGNANSTIYQYSCSTAWDVSTGSYDSKSFSVVAQETSMHGLFFKSDGARFYLVGTTNAMVYQYDTGLAWDINNAGFSAKTFPVNVQDNNPVDLTFKTDGTVVYVIGSTGDVIYQYNCSTAWDLSTAAFNYASNGAFSRMRIVGQETLPTGLFFKSDGTKFYIIGTGNDRVYQYSCSTAWDVSTGSYDNKSFLVSGQESAPTGLFFKDDGTKFYIVGSNNDTIYQYTCSTAWDVSTASYDTKSFSVVTQDSTPLGLFFKDDGTKFYIIGATADRVYQYTCSTAWDVSTGSYDNKSLSVGPQETNSAGVTIDTIGSRLYICGTTPLPAVYQYFLT